MIGRVKEYLKENGYEVNAGGTVIVSTKRRDFVKLDIDMDGELGIATTGAILNEKDGKKFKKELNEALKILKKANEISQDVTSRIENIARQIKNVSEDIEYLSVTNDQEGSNNEEIRELVEFKKTLENELEKTNM